MSHGLTAENIVTGEILGVIEHWYFDGEATHVLLANPVEGCECGERHVWYVNRNGRTLCLICDLNRGLELASERRLRQVDSVREAFRLFRSQA